MALVHVLRAAVAAKIESDCPVALSEIRKLVLEEATAHPDAVDEHDRLALPNVLVRSSAPLTITLGMRPPLVDSPLR